MSIEITTRGIGITINSIEDKEFVEIDIYGTLEHSDYMVLTPVMEHAVLAAKSRELDILIDMRSFEGWSFEAAVDDMKFGLEFRDSFDKMAIVGDKRWEELSVELMNHFSKGEVKFFENYHSAVKWLLH